MNFPQLSNNIQMTHDLLQNNAMRVVNQNITARNWFVDYWIVEFEQDKQIIQSLIGKSQVHKIRLRNF